MIFSTRGMNNEKMKFFLYFYDAFHYFRSIACLLWREICGYMYVRLLKIQNRRRNQVSEFRYWHTDRNMFLLSFRDLTIYTALELTWTSHQPYEKAGHFWYSFDRLQKPGLDTALCLMSSGLQIHSDDQTHQLELLTCVLNIAWQHWP